MEYEVDVRVNNGDLARGMLTFDQEWINVESERATKPDLSWEFVDAAGHWHAFGLKREPFDELPTLNRTAVRVPCDGSCGGVCEGEGFTREEYRCRLCDEVIEPRRVPDPGPRLIAARYDWRVKVSANVPQGEAVVLRMRSAVGEHFGTAVPVGMTASSLDGFSTDLMGAGPLGLRSLPPKCTCPLIDVSVSPQEPSFALGDPTGCKVHGKARDASIAAARAAARGEVSDPFYEPSGVP